MGRVVVDASVAAKWYFPEVHADAARTLLASDAELHAPDFLFIEIANILWKRVRRAEIEADEAEHVLHHLHAVPFYLHTASDRTARAFRLALECGRTAYDCLYLALAEELGCPLVTADRKFLDAIVVGPHKNAVRWVEDLA